MSRESRFIEQLQNCKAIECDDIEAHERIIIECRSIVDQIALVLYSDDIPSDNAVFPVVRTYGKWCLGCGGIFAYGNDSHVAEMRLWIISIGIPMDTNSALPLVDLFIYS